MAAVAPAFAASCGAVNVSPFPFENGTAVGGGATWSHTLTTNGHTIELSAAPSYTRTMTREAGNFDTTPNAGAFSGSSGLQMSQRRAQGTAVVTNHIGTYKFTFSKPVTDLRFTIVDIDDSTDYWDFVGVTPNPIVVSRGNIIKTGNAGTSGDPFRSDNVSLDVTSDRGNVKVRFNGPLSQFSIIYYNGDGIVSGGSAYQQIWLTEMSFTYLPCV